MGNLTSKYQNYQIEQLEKRLSSLEKIDLDGDGIVSKKEFEIWKNEQKLNLKKYRDNLLHKNEQELVKKNNEISKLQLEIEALKKTNSNLENKYNLERNRRITINSTHTTSNIDESNIDESSDSIDLLLSETKISEFVDELLTSENINITYLPDWVERKIYINVLILIMGILKKTLHNTSVKFIGHELHLDLKPC